MVANATFIRPADEYRHTAVAAISSGDIIQLPNGRAAVKQGLDAAVAGDPVTLSDSGNCTVVKTASQVWIDGCRLWWDYSANAATCIPQYADNDFYLGVSVGDQSSAATSCLVNLNVCPAPVIDLHRNGGDTAIVLTAGTPSLTQRGGTLQAAFSATAEAQKLDWLSKRSIPVGSKWVLDAQVEVQTNADADVADLTVGMASATHASDAESIAEHATFHFDMGADLNLDAASDDGTTDVDPTDTTIDWAVGTPLLLTIDGRDSSNLKYYVNGVRVLSGTTFTLAAATGPLKALFHLEKSSNDSPGVVDLDYLAVRIAGE